jgi:hypothetical protein
MYIIWALFFGSMLVLGIAARGDPLTPDNRFKVTEVALMMDWSSGNEGDEEPVEKWDFAKALSTVNDESSEYRKVHQRAAGFHL